jgi:N-acetylneuraminic acid mutarotase
VDAIVSQRQIEQKVEDYLRKSQLVADRRGAPITGNELQAEMERMANHTRRPEVLGELFEALGNDPFVMAECLVKPVLAERLVSSLDADGSAKALAPSATFTVETYKLPEISSLECADSWTPTTIVNAPIPRKGHTAVWTGNEMIIWGGSLQDFTQTNTGGRYDPATDSWTATSIASAPDARWLDSTVWTGIEMIVWGGGNNFYLNSGGRYNPITDTWTATSMVNVPIARDYHTGVWTGSEMIVWGGSGCGGNCKFNTGGRYNPTNDSWTPTNTMNAATARFLHTALWTGSEMIIWGGSDTMQALHTGGRYNPGTDSWTPTALTNVPLGRIGHTAIWTGNEMIVWSGVDETFNVTNTGGRYNPLNDSWVATSLASAPEARSGATGVWTGSELIVWGGADTSGPFNTGGRYNAGTDSWTSTTTVNAPEARGADSAVWTGSEMIVWGVATGAASF